jgi:hypothetical protein
MVIKLGLCQSRHKISEINGYIFPQSVDPIDTEKLERTARSSITEILKNNNLTVGTEPIYIQLYITGLKVTLIAALNVLKRDFGVEKITLYHFDNRPKSYYPQEVE